MLGSVMTFGGKIPQKDKKAHTYSAGCIRDACPNWRVEKAFSRKQ